MVSIKVRFSYNPIHILLATLYFFTQIVNFIPEGSRRVFIINVWGCKEILPSKLLRWPEPIYVRVGYVLESRFSAGTI